MASDDLKRHPPTPRRLARLRQVGDMPHSPVLTYAVAATVASAAAVLLGPRLVALLGSMLARDLQHASLGVDLGAHLSALLAGHLAVAAGTVIATGSTVAGAMVLAHLLQTGLRDGGGEGARGPGLPGTAAQQRTREPVGRTGPWLEAVVGLFGLGVVGAGMIERVAGAANWTEAMSLRDASVLWWRWLAVFAAVGLLHWGRVRASYWRRAAMSDRELQDEAREVAGPPLTRHRRQNARNRARRDG